MNDVSALETLRAIGAQAISMRTHISPENIRKLLAGEFEAFSAVQFNGFVTIIEREYDLDLAEWRSVFSAGNRGSDHPLAPHDNDPFADVTRAKRRQRWTVGLLTTLLLAVIVATYVFLSEKGGEEKIELNNTAINKARENLALLNAAQSTKVQAEVIQQAHQSEAVEAVTESAPVQYEDIIIRPRENLWMGVIDIAAGKRVSRTTAEPYRLDGSKEWLVVTGHGLLSVESDGNTTEYSRRGRMLFLCEEGRCRPIDKAEFKARNQGRIW